jgi:hypothetical protein
MRQTLAMPLDKFASLCYTVVSKMLNDEGVLYYGSW